LWKGANRCEDEFGNATEVGVNGFRAYRSYWHEHPDRDEAWAQQQRAALGTERFRREMECLAHDCMIELQLDGVPTSMPIGGLFDTIDK